jgi:hypothetical protein
MQSLLILICFILLLAVLFIITAIYKIYPKQEAIAGRGTLPAVSANDRSNDSVAATKNAAQCLAWPSSLPSDILATQYYTDGKSLNATVWLSSPIKREANYTMNLNSSPIYNSTSSYEVTISWDDKNGTWTKAVEQLSSNPGTDKEIGPSERKIIEKTGNYTGFYTKGKNYIDFSVDLNKLAIPEEYNLLFYATDLYTSKDGFYCGFRDSTDVFSIPPPNLTISASPPSIELSPGEEKNIELNLNSSSKRGALISLLTKNLTNTLEIDSIPDKIFVPASGSIPVQLHLKALKDASLGNYVLPFYAQITLPTRVANSATDNILNNTRAANVTKDTAVTITVSKSSPTEDQPQNGPLLYSSNIWLYFAILGGIVGGIVALISFVMYSRYQKKRKSRVLFYRYNHLIDENIYNKSNLNKDMILERFVQMRSEILHLHAEGILTQFDFKMLYERISKLQETKNQDDAKRSSPI